VKEGESWMQSEEMKRPTEEEEAKENTTVRGLTPAELRTWMRFWGAMHVVDDALDRDLRAESDLSHNDYQILAMLSNAPERRLRMSELANLVFGSRSRLTYQVTQLERAGLVQREDCPTDKRGAVARLTDRGFEVLQAAAPGHLASVRRIFFDRLTSEQVAVLGEALQIVIDDLGSSVVLERAIDRELTRREEEK
jgi:DNA-binding MarR family transcriptional regulator